MDADVVHTESCHSKTEWGRMELVVKAKAAGGRVRSLVPTLHHISSQYCDSQKASDEVRSFYTFDHPMGLGGVQKRLWFT
jgi:hypothetical protein